MIVSVVIVAILAMGCLAYAAVMRHRDTVARRAWQAHCNEQAVANDAARAARRITEKSSDPVR